MHAAYRLINSTFELNSLVCRLAKLIPNIMQSQYCSVTILDKTRQYSIFRCSNSAYKKYFLDRKTKITNPIERKLIKKSTLIKSDYLLAAPLIADDVIGFIIIRRDPTGKPFDISDHETMATLCEQAVMGIRNIQLYEEQQRILLGSIKSLVTLLDAKVPVAYTHSRYFTRLVLNIGKEMNLDQKDLESLAYASLLHDAGKVDVPIEILTKSSKLTPKEFNIIKYHPIKGAQILKHIQLLKPVVPIILHHHEKYDGTGYPSGLKGNKIPLCARIMSLADAFEAMLYGRPYRKRIVLKKAIKEIKQNSGRQFDPKVVDAFLRALKKPVLKKILHLI